MARGYSRPAGRRSWSRSGARRRSRAPSRTRRKKLALPGVYRFRRSNTITYDLATIGGVSFGVNHHSFNLAQLPNFAEFSALFSQYKITNVTATITPAYNIVPNTMPAATATGPTQIMVYRLYDRQGGFDVETVTEFDESQKVKRMCLLTPGSTPRKVIDFSPSVLVETYKTLTTTGHAPKKLWLDINDSNVEHFGVTLAYKTVDQRNFNSGGSPKVLIQWTYSLSFKGVK